MAEALVIDSLEEAVSIAVTSGVRGGTGVVGKQGISYSFFINGWELGFVEVASPVSGNVAIKLIHAVPKSVF